MENPLPKGLDHFPVELMEARELMAHPQNFRRHPATQRREVQRSMQEFGWLQNVIWNRRTGYILDGHLRVEEAAKKGEQVPVRVVNVSPKVEKRIILAIGKTAEGREIDEVALAALLEEVVREDENLPPGWSQDEVADLLEATAADTEVEPEEEGSEGEEIPAMDRMPDVPLAAIRMVQLFLTQETIDRWNERVTALSLYFETETTTDTVLAAVEYAHQELCQNSDDPDDPVVESVVG